MMPQTRINSPIGPATPITRASEWPVHTDVQRSDNNNDDNNNNDDKTTRRRNMSKSLQVQGRQYTIQVALVRCHVHESDSICPNHNLKLVC